MTIPRTGALRPGLLAVLLAVAGSAGASELPLAELPPIRATLLTFDCEARVLPSQRQVGEILDLHNFAQVYAARTRLMGDVGRACQRPGVERVDVVMQPAAPARDMRELAVHSPSTR